MKLKTIREERNSDGKLFRLQAECSFSRHGKVFCISESDNDGVQKSIDLEEEDVKKIIEFFKKQISVESKNGK